MKFLIFKKFNYYNRLSSAHTRSLWNILLYKNIGFRDYYSNTQYLFKQK